MKMVLYAIFFVVGLSACGENAEQSRQFNDLQKLQMLTYQFGDMPILVTGVTGPGVNKFGEWNVRDDDLQREYFSTEFDKDGCLSDTRVLDGNKELVSVKRGKSDGTGCTVSSYNRDGELRGVDTKLPFDNISGAYVFHSTGKTFTTKNKVAYDKNALVSYIGETTQDMSDYTLIINADSRVIDSWDDKTIKVARTKFDIIRPDENETQILEEHFDSRGRPEKSFSDDGELVQVYEYPVIDKRGSWLVQIRYHPDNPDDVFVTKRTITYTDSSAE